MYFNVNFNVFFKLIKVHLLVSELYIYHYVRCKDEKKSCVLVVGITNSTERYTQEFGTVPSSVTLKFANSYFYAKITQFL